MKADVTRRLTAERAKHYVGVVHQQGRVWLDSDWNSATLERLALLQQETFDIVGECGAPDPGTAFQLTPLPDTGADFQIAGGPGPAGRYYVDGLVAELDQSVPYSGQPDLPDAPPLNIAAPKGEGQEVRGLAYLEVWRRLVTYLEDPELREVALGGPDTATRLKTIAQVRVLVPENSADLSCASAGRFLPRPGHGTLTTLQPASLQPDDPCRLPDPANFTGRENHLYRVEIHDAGEVLGGTSQAAVSTPLAADVPAAATTLTLATALTSAQASALRRSGAAMLADNLGSEIVAVSGIDSAGTTLTLADPVAGSYTTANGAALTSGAARFKWSRDNASFAVRVTAVSTDGSTLTLDSLGRDQATTLRQGDLVEIEDDASALGPARGHLTFLKADPDPDLLTAVLVDPLPSQFQVARHLTLRRWDGDGWARATFDPTTTPDLDLGDGVHIEFGGSDLRPGDYWQFAARSIDGSIEALSDAPPAGIRRHICPLGVIHWQQRAYFSAKPLLAAFEEVQATDVQLEQVKKAIDERDIDHHPLDQQSAEQLAAGLNPPLTAAQIAALDEVLAKLSAEDTDGVELRTIISGIDDCRETFEPLTKLRSSPCDCTIAVAPGESIPAALDKVGNSGGTICLLPGLHQLDATVQVTKRSNLTLRGAGNATVVETPEPSAFHFDGCDHITLRDFAVVSGKPADAASKATLQAQDEVLNLLKQLEGPPVAAVLSFTGCRAVEIAACRVRALAHTGNEVGRPCVAFAAAHQENQAATLDLTVRDCRFEVDQGQSGLLIVGGSGVVVEDTWVFNLAATQQPRLTLAGGAAAARQLGLYGIAVVDSVIVRVSRAVLVGLEVAALIQGPGHEVASSIAGNCRFGVVAVEADDLLLSDNIIETTLGVALWVSSSGEVQLTGNVAHAPAPQEETHAALGAVAQIQAATALLSHNSFLAVGERPASHAVDVRAVAITYGGNRSVCEALPTQTNVVLFAAGAGPANEGKLTAWGNTCLEPVTQPLNDLLGKADELAKAQSDAMGAFLNGGALGALQEKLTPVERQWATLQDPLLKAVDASKRVSLVAVGAYAVTGLNLLSYGLLRVGIGQDQGTQTGVF